MKTYSQYFEVKNEKVVLTDDAPEELKEIVSGLFEDSFVGWDDSYRMSRKAVQNIEEALDYNYGDIERVDIGEVANASTPASTSRLTAWLARSNNHLQWLTDELETSTETVSASRHLEGAYYDAMHAIARRFSTLYR